VLGSETLLRAPVHTTHGARDVGAAARRTVRDTQAVLELRLDAQLVEPDVDLWAAAVHEHWPDAHRGEEHQVIDHALLCAPRTRTLGAGCCVLTQRE